MWLAVGQWTINEVHLLRLAGCTPAVIVPISQGQPRSIAMAEFGGGSSFLCVGTADGGLVYYDCQVQALPAVR